MATQEAALCGALALEAQKRFRTNEAQQVRAWLEEIALLKRVFAGLPAAGDWHVFFEVTLPRTDRRADVVVVGGGIAVLEFKIGAERFETGARVQAEDFALDLWDFHAGSRNRRIVPMVVATHAALRPAQDSLKMNGVGPVVDAIPDTLAARLTEALASTPVIDAAAWRAAPYRPVPSIIEAATTLYARHTVEDILDAGAGAHSLARTAAAITDALHAARDEGRRVAVFVTGVPGAGKTLCGLNACFAGVDNPLRGTFLTGNPTLVHVLREALARHAHRHQGMSLRAARQRMEGLIQALPKFRDKYAGSGEVPAERVIVIDEAQRSWAKAHAVRKSRDRAVQLWDSEPAHLLAAMARHADWAGIVCLIGSGQEIHDGEGGLAEWGIALGDAGWLVIAPPECRTARDRRQRLPELPHRRLDPRLHLPVATRQIRNPDAATWVDAVLAGDAAAAGTLAGADLPFELVRSVEALRTRLRQCTRAGWRSGLVASSDGKRLRAEGLGVELPHMDATAVAHWFLDHWPDDVRASGALEVVGTEFSVQGLELDIVGVCWDADLVRHRGQWRSRRFAGTNWQHDKSAERISNHVNTYRVLLTRARRHTVIYVPQGDARDRTRDPADYAAVAAFLRACGVREGLVTREEIIQEEREWQGRLV